MRRVLSGACGFLLTLCLWLLSLAVLLQAAGTSSGMMQAMLETHAPPAYTGLPQEHYPGMAKMICRYLAGQTEEFQYVIEDGYGRQVYVFQTHEQQHMADCRQLFVLDRTVLLLCMAAAGVLLLLLFLLRQARSAARGSLLGGTLALLLLTGAGIWAAVDFNSLFVLFHRLSFANDLWLLNPATDMLIRLMPIGFFTHYVTLIGITWLLALMLMMGIAALVLRHSGAKATGVHHEL